jgi:PAS domain S-box-containing protein
VTVTARRLPAPLSPRDTVFLLERQTGIMQLIADGTALPAVLDAVVLALEDLMDDARCSILLLEPGESTLRHGAAPSLPVEYSSAIDGMAIGSGAGSCGTAAYLGIPVVAEDVAVDPRWTDYRDVALPFALRSCWSTPIRGREGIVGTFAVYHQRPHRPDLRERGLVDRFTHLASVAIDHHRLYGELADSEERFRRAFEDNTVGMALTELDGRVIRANRALTALLGRYEPDILGHDLTELIRPADGARDAANFEALATRPDGRSVRLAVAASTVRDAAGVPVRLCLTLLDITQRWEAARERRARERADDARRSAEAASRAKSAFVSALGHELRTPLQAITGFTELLGGLDLSPAQRQQALTHIGGATEHILALVDDVLDLARVEAGSMPLRVQDVDPAALGAEVIDMLRPLADSRAVTMTQQVTAVAVRADPRRLRQVLLNVIGNAIRYNLTDGRVELTGEPAPGGRFLLAVRDTGPGIAQDLMHRLFVPFDRLGADQGPERGVGLGLVLSRSLTEAMDGRLEVTSRVGQGTAVRIELPTGSA